MVPVLEAVPNFSSGRDRSFLDRLVRTAEEEGAEVLDVSADADHNRSVLTLVGGAAAVESASLALAALAVSEIDLGTQTGIHPRVGALDVLPIVPLSGVTMAVARRTARRIGERIAREVGVPAFLYGEASEPPGRLLSEIRKGGFEGMREGFPDGLQPDMLPAGWSHPGAHPTAGVVCVGARPLLLAWNVEVRGLGIADLRELARGLREAGGGFRGLRVLAMERGGGLLPQISMNLEDVGNHSPFSVFRAIEQGVADRGGTVAGTEVIGLLPDRLAFEAGADRIGLLEAGPDRLLGGRILDHVQTRVTEEVGRLMETIDRYRGDIPLPVIEAAGSLAAALDGSSGSEEE
jgi:glutamate formiminotransferase